MTGSRRNVFGPSKGGLLIFTLLYGTHREISHRIKFKFHYCGAQLDPIPALLLELGCVKLAVILAK